MPFLRPNSCCFCLSLETGSFLTVTVGIFVGLMFIVLGQDGNHLPLCPNFREVYLYLGFACCITYSAAYYELIRRKSNFFNLFLWASLPMCLLLILLLSIAISETLKQFENIKTAVYVVIYLIILIMATIGFHIFAVLYRHYIHLKERENSERYEPIIS